VGPQGQSGQVQKILYPPGFNPWTVQSIATELSWPTVHHFSLNIDINPATVLAMSCSVYMCSGVTNR